MPDFVVVSEEGERKAETPLVRRDLERRVYNSIFEGEKNANGSFGETVAVLVMAYAEISFPSGIVPAKFINSQVDAFLRGTLDMPGAARVFAEKYKYDGYRAQAG